MKQRLTFNKMLLVSCFLLSGCNIAIAVDGQLDVAGFNAPNGFVNNIAGFGAAVGIDSNNNVIVTGRSTSGLNPTITSRYSSTGVEDSSFATNAATEVLDNTGHFGIVVLPDNSSIIIGQDTITSGNMSLARYDATGMPDAAYIANVEAAAIAGNPYSISLQSDSKVVVALADSISGFAKAVRFNVDGTVDGTFTSPTPAALTSTATVATDGSIFFGIFGSSGNITVYKLTSTGTISATSPQIPATDLSAIVSLPDGSIIILGTTLLVKLNPDLTLDAAFNSNAVTSLANPLIGPFATLFAAVIQADGKIVATGYNGTNEIVARFNADGTLDTTFNDLGVTTITQALNALSVALDLNNRIITGGTSSDASNILVAALNNTPNKPSLIYSPIAAAILAKYCA